MGEAKKVVPLFEGSVKDTRKIFSIWWRLKMLTDQPERFKDEDVIQDVIAFVKAVGSIQYREHVSAAIIASSLSEHFVNRFSKIPKYRYPNTDLKKVLSDTIYSILRSKEYSLEDLKSSRRKTVRLFFELYGKAELDNHISEEHRSIVTKRHYYPHSLHIWPTVLFRMTNILQLEKYGMRLNQM